MFFFQSLLLLLSWCDIWPVTWHLMDSMPLMSHFVHLPPHSLAKGGHICFESVVICELFVWSYLVECLRYFHDQKIVLCSSNLNHGIHICILKASVILGSKGLATLFFDCICHVFELTLAIDMNIWRHAITVRFWWCLPLVQLYDTHIVEFSLGTLCQDAPSSFGLTLSNLLHIDGHKCGMVDQQLTCIWFYIALLLRESDT